MINTIVCGDCLEVMLSIPDSSIDMILCDLPYGVTARNKWDVVVSFEPLWAQYKRVAKPNAAIALTATQPFASKLVMSNEAMFRYDIIWRKSNSTGFYNVKKMPMRAHESILIFYDDLPVYNPQKTNGHKPGSASYTRPNNSNNYRNVKEHVTPGGQTDRFPVSVIDIAVVNNNDKDEKCKWHPTQKPVALFEYLIRTYTNEGDIVLDNCIGSGTTAVACLKTGRKYIGIEKDEAFTNAARLRVESMAWEDF